MAVFGPCFELELYNIYILCKSMIYTHTDIHLYKHMLACTLWHERACTPISVTLGMHKHHTHLGPWKKAIPLDDAFLRYRLFSLVNLSHALFCSCIILQSAGLCVIIASAYIYAISVLQVPGSLINVKLTSLIFPYPIPPCHLCPV